MTKRPKDAPVGSWAREKLDALGRYLDYYTRVLKNQNWCKGTLYVDAFAGPGVSPLRATPENKSQSLLIDPATTKDKDTIEYLKGSPRVALDISNPFSRYLFIESNPARVKELEALRAEYGATRTIEIVEGDANTHLTELLASGIDWRKHRAVVFLDPWGMQPKWQILEQLAQTRAIEVIINFPWGMAIQRLLINTGEIPQAWQQILDDYFGSPEWRRLTYEESPTLFGPTKRKMPSSATRLLEWYCGRLRTIFGHVSTARLIKSASGRQLYYLIWAGPHPMGLKGANYILKKVTKVG